MGFSVFGYFLLNTKCFLLVFCGFCFVVGFLGFFFLFRFIIFGGYILFVCFFLFFSSEQQALWFANGSLNQLR